MPKYKCPCCGCYTLDERGAYDICPVCFWEDDAYIFMKDGEIKGILRMEYDVSDEDILDIPSGANDCLTLREGRENYKKIGACEESMREHVRPPREDELPDSKGGGL